MAVQRFAVVVVLGRGALEHLASMTRKFLGGPVGSGRQCFLWIHREDLVRAILFFRERLKLDGVFNLCASSPVRQIDLAPGPEAPP